MAENILTDRNLAVTLRREDYGLFGPDSIAWRIWSHPTILLGLQRAVALQFLNPFFTAAQHDAKLIYTQPGHFYDITLAFLLTGVLGDSRTALETSDFIMAVHTHATGIEPVSGKRYHANSPEAQLYTHVCGWQSMLKCYEVFGPGPLSPYEEARYWDECVTAANLFTCKPESVPATRSDVRDYYAQVRPQFIVTENAKSGFYQQLRTSGDYANVRLRAISRFAAPASVATMPAWVREAFGVKQSAAGDRLAVAAMRPGLRALATSQRATWTAVGLIAPTSAAVIRQHHIATVPTKPETVTYEQARQRYSRGAGDRITPSGEANGADRVVIDLGQRS